MCIAQRRKHRRGSSPGLATGSGRGDKAGGNRAVGSVETDIVAVKSGGDYSCTW